MLARLAAVPRRPFAGLGKRHSVSVLVLKRLDQPSSAQMPPSDLIKAPQLSATDAGTFAAHGQISIALRRPESLQCLGRPAATNARSNRECAREALIGQHNLIGSASYT